MTYYLCTQDHHVYDFSHKPNGDHWQPLSRAAGKKAQATQALESLRRIFDAAPGGDNRVYCVLRHVSASGMSRRIDFYVIRENRPQYLTGLIGQALDYRLHDRGGLIVGGCGMDMGFHVVYSLSSALYDSTKGSDGGYTLKSEWI